GAYVAVMAPADGSDPVPRRASYSFVEAAAVCRVSRDTIKRRHRAGQFPNAWRANTRGGSHQGPWMIPAADLLVAGLPVFPATMPQGTRPPASEAVLQPKEDVTDLRVRLAAAEARGDALEQALRIVA